MKKQLILLAAAAMLAACGIKMPETTPVSYATLTVQKSEVTYPLKFSAKMTGQHDVTIMPQVSGQLMQISVSEGARVKKGDVLFVIDSRNAELELQSAEANLLAAEAKESSAKMEWESNQNLYAKDIVSRYMLDNAENNYKQAQAAVCQARAAADRARVNLGFCTITAPVSGMIGEIPVHLGDQVAPGTRLTMLSDNTNLQAEFSVTESLIEDQVGNGETKHDQKKLIENLPEATFVMKNGTEYPHKGRVTSVTGVVNATTGTLACKATFPNPDGQLYSGIQGTVVLPISEKDLIVIPQLAVLRLQDKNLVYVVQPDSTVASVAVTVFPTGNGKDVVVTKGLNVGDRVVTEGVNNLQEGQRVLFPETAK